ncbi:MAG TPA: T9SS type A sorting domain-containing protein, partial [Bacteroidales bacterium]|nr:T9SS type A sorting domain-containing protein [Bacteroidales bacterium]
RGDGLHHLLFDFQPGQGLNSLVYTLAVQSDGRILVGGAFSLAAGQPRTRIARLMPDGSLDTSFNPGSGANGGVRSISLQADGKILIGGDFSSYNGVSVNRIARLLPDGSLDPSFLNQGGTNGTVKSIAIQTDGRIILGGTFTNLMGSVAGRVGRLIGDTCSLAAQISVDTLAAGGMIQLSTATPAGASYAWIDCSNGNAPIPGASAAVFTPQLPGNYAVVVQQSYCSDTSACVQVNPVITGTSAASAGTTFRVFPNPATDRLMLAVSGEPSGYGLRLFQANGTCALRLDGLSGPLQELMLPELVPGLYFLEIQGKNGVYRQKLIIR